MTTILTEPPAAQGQGHQQPPEAALDLQLCLLLCLNCYRTSLQYHFWFRKGCNPLT